MPTPGTTRSDRPVEASNGSQVTLDYKRDLIVALAASASESFLKFPFGGLEVGGVLFGQREGNTLRILAFRNVPSKYANGPGFLLSPDDEAALRGLLFGYDSDPALAGMIPVGWYRSHNRRALRLSPEDVIIHDRYFAESWHLAIVMKPEAGKPVRVGFFLRGESSSVDPARPWHETKIEIGDGQAPEEPETVAPSARSEITPRPEPEIPAFLRGADAAASGSGRRWKWVVAIVLLVLLALAAAGWWFWQSRQASPVALDARAFDDKGMLRVQWVPPPDAVDGAIDINQGGSPSTFPLNASQVKLGTAEFARHTQSVGVRIAIRRGDGKLVHEYTRFVKASGPADIEETIGRAVEERERRSGEVREAREELRREVLRREDLARRFVELRQSLAGAQ